jgi:hypothetical protein
MTMLQVVFLMPYAVHMDGTVKSFKHGDSVALPLSLATKYVERGVAKASGDPFEADENAEE